MIGYVRPQKDELKLKEYRRYKAFYCTLCHAIGKGYGVLYRFALSNDLTFLLICLDSLVPGDRETVVSRCPGNPLKKTSLTVHPGVLDYVAFLNVFLLIQKLRDEIADSRTAVRRFFFRALCALVCRRGAYRRARARYQASADALEERFRRLDALERDAAASADDLLNAFGEVMRAFLTEESLRLPREDARLLGDVLFNLGKWIYLADALDDYEKDRRSGAFNLLDRFPPETVRDEASRFRTCRWIVLMIRKKMKEAFDPIAWQRDRAMIENVLFPGAAAVWEQIRRKKRKNREGDPYERSTDAANV